MNNQRLFKESSNCESGVQSLERILINDLYLAAKIPEPPTSQSKYVLAID
jgi:hypothetical protein